MPSEASIIQEVTKLVNSPALSKLILTLILGLTIHAYRYFKKMILEIYNEVKYNQFYLQAVDKANEHAHGNGYSNARDEELSRLLNKNNFIRKV